MDKVKGTILRVEPPKDGFDRILVDVKTGAALGVTLYVPQDHEMAEQLLRVPNGTEIEVDGLQERLVNGRLKPRVALETVIVLD